MIYITRTRHLQLKRTQTQTTSRYITSPSYVLDFWTQDFQPNVKIACQDRRPNRMSSESQSSIRSVIKTEVSGRLSRIRAKASSQVVIMKFMFNKFLSVRKCIWASLSLHSLHRVWTILTVRLLFYGFCPISFIEWWIARWPLNKTKRSTSSSPALPPVTLMVLPRLAWDLQLAVSRWTWPCTCIQIYALSFSLREHEHREHVAKLTKHTALRCQ